MQAYYETLSMKVRCKRELCYNNECGKCTLLSQPAERKDGTCAFYKTRAEFKNGIKKYGWYLMPERWEYLLKN